jgi:tetratricopeptide (TPR) repeat protein
VSANQNPLQAFRRLLETTASADPLTEGPILLTDSLVGSRQGKLLRRCALPHEFDAAVLQVLGDLDEAEAQDLFVEFSELSMMQFTGAAMSVHERWRRPLWAWWLERPRRAEFEAINARLADWFASRHAETGSDDDLRRSMFHRIGARREEGLELFQTLFRIARHRMKATECGILIRLVREYDPVLTRDEIGMLAYQEGKVASDLRQWDEALEHFREARGLSADEELLAKTFVREAHALRALGRNEEALGLLDRAGLLTEGNARLAPLNWSVQYELGEVYREMGDIERAHGALTSALAGAERNGDAARAGVLNSLGTVQLRRREVAAAVESFHESLALLEREGDAVRPGVVFNNLGLAQIEELDWSGAERSFLRSLASKRAAGDRVGQGVVLLNLSRVEIARERFAEASALAGDATRLFEEEGNPRLQARGLLARAKLHSRVNEKQAAIDLADHALRCAQASGDAELAANATDELARLHGRRTMPWWAIAMMVLTLVGFVLLIVAAVYLDARHHP